MTACTHCGTTLIDTPQLSYCPKCLDCFIPSRQIDQEFEEEETFDRIRSYLTGSPDEGQLVILAREHGTGCTTALNALATHQVLPHALPDFAAFYFDADSPVYRLDRDFRHFLRSAIRAYDPRYEAPDADSPRACALMLAALAEQTQLRAARKKLILFIALPDSLPTEFLRGLPRGRNLPKHTALFLICTPAQTQTLQQLLPRVRVLPPVCLNGALHMRAVRRLLDQSVLRRGWRQRLRSGEQSVEEALRLTKGDYHRIYLLDAMRKAAAFPPDTLPQTDLWSCAFQFYGSAWGAERIRRVCAFTAMIDTWPTPVPPMLLPALCGLPPETLADTLRFPELIRVSQQGHTVVVSLASQEAAAFLRSRSPELFAGTVERLVALATGTEQMPELPHSGLCRFFSSAADAVARHGTAEQLHRLMANDAVSYMCRTMADARRAETMTAAEEEEVWDARIRFTQSTHDLLSHLDACNRRKALHEAQNTPSGVIADITALLQALQPICPGRPEGRKLLAELYAQRGEWNLRACRARAALEDYNRAIRFAEPLPESGELSEDSRRTLIRLLLMRASFARKHRMHEQLADDLDRAILLLQQSDAPDADAWTQALRMRAQLMIRVERYDRAQADLEAAGALLPQVTSAENARCCTDIYRMQGQIYDSTGEPLKAAASYGRLIALYRSQDKPPLRALAQAYAARAAAHEQNHDFDCAYADRSEAIEMLLQPTDRPATELAQAYLARARLLGRVGRAQEGADDCTEAIRLLEPLVGGSERAPTLLCTEAYRERESLYMAVGCEARADEDRRRLRQLRILLR